MKPGFYFLTFIFFSTTLFAQKIKIGFGSGYSYIDNNISPSKEVVQNSLPSSLELKHCFTLNTKMKYQNTKFPVNLTWELIYISAINNFDFLGYTFLQQEFPEVIHLKASKNVYSLNIGVESQIIKAKSTAYFLIGILANYFGKTKIVRNPEPDTSVTKNEPVTSDVFGIGINAGLGIEYPVYKNISIDISAKYSFMNLGGESNVFEDDYVENFNTIGITAILYFLL